MNGFGCAKVELGGVVVMPHPLEVPMTAYFILAARDHRTVSRSQARFPWLEATLYLILVVAILIPILSLIQDLGQ